jgi:oligopeptide/dipeptide ABC transporter ATP-binding protein
MYAGRVAEYGPVRDIFSRPTHPYTSGLLECLPRLDTRQTVQASIPGVPATPMSLPPGCPFSPRCRHAVPACSQVEPSLQPSGNSMVACPVMRRAS